MVEKILGRGALPPQQVGVGLGGLDTGHPANVRDVMSICTDEWNSLGEEIHKSCWARSDILAVRHRQAVGDKPASKQPIHTAKVLTACLVAMGEYSSFVPGMIEAFGNGIPQPKVSPDYFVSWLDQVEQEEADEDVED